VFNSFVLTRSTVRDQAWLSPGHTSTAPRLHGRFHVLAHSRNVVSSTEMYKARPVDARMLRVLADHLHDRGHVLDVGCGAGQYGEHLTRIAGAATGTDIDPELTATAIARGGYRAVHTMPADEVASLGSFQAVFCSEVLEHLHNDQLRPALDAIEAAATERVVITVPHPRAPHFKQDPTHVLSYSVRSFRRELNTSTKFRYEAHGIGFHSKFSNHPLIRVLQPLARRFVHLSPTLLFVGKPICN
jgi:SAM-dependent methyltransferase